MNEIKKLSGRCTTFDVERGESVTIPDSEIKQKDGQKVFTYYRVLTRYWIYRIPESECEAKLKSINDGAKFIELQGDIVNINEIKRFNKRVAYK
jgi:hypothetical protein